MQAKWLFENQVCENEQTSKWKRAVHGCQATGTLEALGFPAHIFSAKSECGTLRLPHLKLNVMGNWGFLWAPSMAAENFGQNAYILWQRIGLRGCHKVFWGFLWQWMQVAIEISWNPLDSAIHVFKKTYGISLSLSHSLSLYLCLCLCLCLSLSLSLHLSSVSAF